MTAPKSIACYGITYKRLYDFALYLDIAPSTLSHKLNDSRMTPEEIWDEVNGRPKKPKYTGVRGWGGK